MAEANQVSWIDGQANVRDTKENILPRSHEYDDRWNDSYNYISDYDCIFDHPVNPAGIRGIYGEKLWQGLQDAKQAGTRIRINNLAHFTCKDNATGIIKSKGFKGREKKIDENERGDVIKKCLSWWSPKFTEEDINLVRKTLHEAIMHFYGENDEQEILKNQFATSDAFLPNKRRYGGIFFEYGINELCQHYEKYRAIGQEIKIQYKILGTYVYKQEIMYAVLVCSDKDKQFAKYPAVSGDGNNGAVVTRNNQNWVWRPQATSTIIRRLDGFEGQPKFRRWEHVAFAFYVPHDVFDLPELKAHRYELKE